MTSADTSKARDGSNFGKVIAFGIAAIHQYQQDFLPTDLAN